MRAGPVVSPDVAAYESFFLTWVSAACEGWPGRFA